MLLNKSKAKGVIKNVRFARTYWERFRGLMFRARSSFDYALVFELPKESRVGASIHMLFVFFPTDVVYLDAKKRVREVVHKLKPFALNHTPRKPAKYLVELPVGRARDIAEGDELAW